MKRRFVIAMLIAALCGAPALAGDPQPFADFTFKRMKPPKPGAKKRITVQIEPRAPAPPAAAPPKDAPAALALGGGPKPGASMVDWFWNEVPVAGPGPGGIAGALAALQKAPAGSRFAAPRLDTLNRIADRHGRDILKATIGTRVSPAFALAVIAIESAGRTDARSSAGAEGLMQLMPDTARRFGVADSLHASENIRGGVTYLDWLMGEFGDDPILALAGYNAGEGAVRKHAGVPPYAETRAYVPKVLAAWSVARGLCLTPPMLMSDGCVFIGRSAATNG